jgi:Tol biopolymer transport system component
VSGEGPLMGNVSRRRLGAIGACLVLAIGLAASLAAEAGTGGTETTRLSVSSHEARANARSRSPSISLAGRFVAFRSEATNLIPRDTNGEDDVFVRDRKTGTTRRVSVSSGGEQARRWSHSPSISADGRFVAFESEAPNLVRGDTNREIDVFVHDRMTRRTTRVSVSSRGEQANSTSLNAAPAISASGRFVAFRSLATNLVPNDLNREFDVFLHDRRTGRTERVSVNSAGEEANGKSYGPAISARGRFVAFTSWATNLAGHMNQLDVFIHDRATGKTSRVGPGYSIGDPSISADGRFVAFDGGWVIFVWDRVTRETERVDISSNGTPANRKSLSPAISANGRFVAFESRATNLVPRDVNGLADIFVHDRRNGKTRMVSLSSRGEPANAHNGRPAITGAGRFIAFDSKATNLVAGDRRPRDVFVRGPLWWGSR